jgi:hypothetical protein
VEAHFSDNRLLKASIALAVPKLPYRNDEFMLYLLPVNIGLLLSTFNVVADDDNMAGCNRLLSVPFTNRMELT